MEASECQTQTQLSKCSICLSITSTRHLKTEDYLVHVQMLLLTATTTMIFLTRTKTTMMLVKKQTVTSDRPDTQSIHTLHKLYDILCVCNKPEHIVHHTTSVLDLYLSRLSFMGLYFDCDREFLDFISTFYRHLHRIGIF